MCNIGTCTDLKEFSVPQCLMSGGSTNPIPDCTTTIIAII